MVFFVSARDFDCTAAEKMLREVSLNICNLYDHFLVFTYNIMTLLTFLRMIVIDNLSRICEVAFQI